MGTPESEIGSISKFIEDSNTVVISPDYILSLEEPYLAALNDCYDTLLWMKNNAEKLEINDSRLCVVGASAGEGLTAATTLYAKDKGEANTVFQMPIYPMLKDKMNTPSMTLNKDSFVWDYERNRIA